MTRDGINSPIALSETFGERNRVSSFAATDVDHGCSSSDSHFSHKIVEEFRSSLPQTVIERSSKVRFDAQVRVIGVLYPGLVHHSPVESRSLHHVIDRLEVEQKNILVAASLHV